MLKSTHKIAFDAGQATTTTATGTSARWKKLVVRRCHGFRSTVPAVLSHQRLFNVATCCHFDFHRKLTWKMPKKRSDEGNVDRGGHARQKGGRHKFQLDKTQSRQRCLYNAFTSHWPIKYALKLRLIPIDKAQLHRSQHVLGWAQSEQCHLRFLCKFNFNFAAEKYLWKRLFAPHVANVQLKRVCRSKVLPRSACLLFVRLFV